MARELKLIKTLWGIDEPISPNLLKQIKAEGYHGIEVIRLAWTLDRVVLINSLNESGLAVVCQIHTTGGYLDEGEYIYCGKYDVPAHKDDFKKQIMECRDFIGLINAGGFINAHAGVDAWSKDEAIDFLEYCQNEIEQTIPNITCTFETHRQRLFGSPFQTRDLLAPGSLSKLKLNADLSHWYCSCERVFNADDDRDKWWPDLLKDVISPRCEYIHARLGWAQGPQMADPTASECEVEKNLQLKVWKMLMEDQRRGDASTAPRHIYASPEYGPPPYMPVKPHSQKPLASLSGAVAYTKILLEEIYQSM
jgi:sugar phosphate isomerase/epimerase